MGWNCFKGETSGKDEGKTPIGERISQSLRTRFPRLYKLIKRIKENGAPSKIKLRRKRKLNSLVHVTSIDHIPSQQRISKKTNKDLEKILQNPRKLRNSNTVDTSDNTTLKGAANNNTDVVHSKANSIIIQVTPAEGQPTDDETLSLNSEDSNTAAVQVITLVKNVVTDVLDEVIESMDTGVAVKAGSITVSPAPNQAIRDDTSSTSSEISSLVSTQIASFVSNVVRRAVQEVSRDPDRDAASISTKGSVQDVQQVSVLVNNAVTTDLQELEGCPKSLPDGNQEDCKIIDIEDEESIADLKMDKMACRDATFKERQGGGAKETFREVIDLDDEKAEDKVSKNTTGISSSPVLGNSNTDGVTGVANNTGSVVKTGSSVAGNKLPATMKDRHSVQVPQDEPDGHKAAQHTRKEYVRGDKHAGMLAAGDEVSAAGNARNETATVTGHKDHGLDGCKSVKDDGIGATGGVVSIVNDIVNSAIRAASGNEVNVAGERYHGEGEVESTVGAASDGGYHKCVVDEACASV